MKHISVEMKARCSNPEKIRNILKRDMAEAFYKGTDHQIDTYFNVDHGRLKLREGDIENHLIYYENEDIEGSKRSNVQLIPTVVHGKSLKEILTKSLGVFISVDKKREIYFIGNVRFHIDMVKDLGSFVGIEAISSSEVYQVGVLREQCNHYMNLFGITDEDLISRSYGNMLLEALNRK